MGFRTRDKVVAGSLAPNFTLPSQSGKVVVLRDFLGKKPVILYFYPKDDTPGCTKELAPSGSVMRTSESSMPRS